MAKIKTSLTREKRVPEFGVFKNWIIEKAEALSESHQIPLGGYDDDSSEQSYLYRNITTPQIDEKLQPIDQERLIKSVVYLWQGNPLIYNSVEMIKDYCVGPGLQIACENENLKEVINAHWLNPENGWALDQGARFRDLFLFGELAPLMFPSDINGYSKVGVLHPLLIKEIQTDPENIAFPIKIIETKVGPGDKEREHWIVKLDVDGTYGKKIGGRYKDKDTKGRLVGDAFYFPLNRLLSSTRGRSSLFAAVDWVAEHDDFIFMRVENAKVAGSFIWDVMLKGYKSKAIKKWIDQLPEQFHSGMIRAHSDKVVWSAVAPNMNASDAKEEDRLIMKMILSAVGLPEHWVTGQGADVNRASALAMGDPTFMRLRSLQQYYTQIVRQIIQYHIDHVIMFSDAKRFGEEGASMEFDVIAPPIEVKDPAKTADTLSKVAQAVTTATMEELIDKKDAARLFVSIANQFDIEMEIAEALKGEETV